MPKPLLTLTTDFGVSDHYVGVLKGVILQICPAAQIVDISHEVEPYAIPEGAFLIAQAYRYFPAKTVHVVVVDPGVGSLRRPLLLEAAGQYFIAPDNGVLGMVAAREKHRARVISNRRYFLEPVSHTFHGRDIFAPVAAHIAAGVPSSHMGKPIDDYILPEFLKPRRSDGQTWLGQVLRIDRFGNIITNFQMEEFPVVEHGRFSIEICSRKIDRLAHHYAERGPGELFAIAGSSGFLEISMNQAPAARRIGCEPGDPVQLTAAD